MCSPISLVKNRPFAHLQKGRLMRLFVQAVGIRRLRQELLHQLAIAWRQIESKQRWV